MFILEKYNGFSLQGKMGIKNGIFGGVLRSNTENKPSNIFNSTALQANRSAPSCFADNITVIAQHTSTYLLLHITCDDLTCCTQAIVAPERANE